MLLKVILVPFITFAGVSVFRKCVNAKRPYTIYGTTPIVAKDKTGESMPSRHTASFTVIAMTWLYVNPAAGVIMLVLAFFDGCSKCSGRCAFCKRCTCRSRYRRADRHYRTVSYLNANKIYKMSNANNGYEYIKYNKSRDKNMTGLKQLFKKSSKAAAGIMGRTVCRRKVLF